MRFDSLWRPKIHEILKFCGGQINLWSGMEVDEILKIEFGAKETGWKWLEWSDVLTKDDEQLDKLGSGLREWISCPKINGRKNRKTLILRPPNWWKFDVIWQPKLPQNPTKSETQSNSISANMSKTCPIQQEPRRRGVKSQKYSILALVSTLSWEKRVKPFPTFCEPMIVKALKVLLDGWVKYFVTRAKNFVKLTFLIKSWFSSERELHVYTSQCGKMKELLVCLHFAQGCLACLNKKFRETDVFT